MHPARLAWMLVAAASLARAEPLDLKPPTPAPAAAPTAREPPVEAPPSVMLKGVTVKARPATPADESLGKARQAVAQAMQHRPASVGDVAAALAHRFSILPDTPPEASHDSADRADAIAQPGIGIGPNAMP
jgi:hypothetical protein